MSNRKLGEMILHIAKESKLDERFGATKLNKILFFADFAFYSKRRKSISGDVYQKLKNGPAPKHLVSTRERLIQEKALAIQKIEYFGLMQERPVPLRDPDLDFFSAEEIAMIDSVIRRFWDKDGTDVSLLSHEFIGWRVAREQEIIPYGAALIRKQELSTREIERGLELGPLAEKILGNAA